MELPAIAPHEFFIGIVYVGLALLLCIYFPVQIAAKWRRLRAVRTRISCRICGYRFLRQDPHCRCPHCQARNR